MDRVLTFLALAVARVWPAGVLPYAPGTWGSFVAVALAPWCLLPYSPPTRGVVVLAVIIVGGLAAGLAEKRLARKDPGEVVIDEVAGQWLTFMHYTDIAIWELAAGFALFRLFDIAKPFPIRRAEKWLPGGWGVMLDDLMAGVYAGLALGALRFLTS